METLLFRYPNQKLIPVWKLSTNITRLFGVTTLSSLILLYLNQMYIFSKQENNNYYYKFSFFAGNPFKNKHVLFEWWDQKWRETEINASSSCENKVLSLTGLRQETIHCCW